MNPRTLSLHKKIIIKRIKDTHMHAAIRNAESDEAFLLNLLLRSQKSALCFASVSVFAGE